MKIKFKVRYDDKTDKWWVMEKILNQNSRPMWTIDSMHNTHAEAMKEMRKLVEAE